MTIWINKKRSDNKFMVTIGFANSGQVYDKIYSEDKLIEYIKKADKVINKTSHIFTGEI